MVLTVNPSLTRDFDFIQGPLSMENWLRGHYSVVWTAQVALQTIFFFNLEYFLLYRYVVEPTLCPLAHLPTCSKANQLKPGCGEGKCSVFKQGIQAANA